MDLLDLNANSATKFISVTLVKSNLRQIIALSMQSAQILMEIIYANACQVSGRTQTRFSPGLATISMNVSSFHLVMQGKVSKILARVELPVRVSLRHGILETIKCIML